MEREDVVHVLRRFRRALAPGGAILDLQVIAPSPVVEVDGEVVCRLDGGTLLEDAAAAAGVIDEEIARGLLREEAVDDHDVLRHFSTGASLVEHFRTRPRSIPASAVSLLEASARPHVVREACRLRRLRALGGKYPFEGEAGPRAVGRRERAVASQPRSTNPSDVRRGHR